MNTYRIYTRKLAVNLRKKGFKIVANDVNNKNPKFDVYIFEDTPLFRQTLTELTRLPK